MSTNKGRLTCVGTGIRLGGQITAIAKSHIETADVVIAAVADQLTKQWLQGLAKDYICLAGCYGKGGSQGKSRKTTYREMADRILSEVRSGKNVCAAFYGHPGVFACIANIAIKDAKTEGFAAQMLPGISAEDCLVADLGMDPGSKGMQSMEATQFLIYRRNIDPTAMLILWQPGVVGDLSLKRFDTSTEHLELLVEKLTRIYPPEHEVILYEAATNMLEQTRIEHLPLKDLSRASLCPVTTLVIPPAAAFEDDLEFRGRLEALAASGTYSTVSS